MFLFSAFPTQWTLFFGSFLLNGRLPSCCVLNRSQDRKCSNLGNRHSRSNSKCSLKIDSRLTQLFQTSPYFNKDKVPAFPYDSIVNGSISRSTGVLKKVNFQNGRHSSLGPKEIRQLFSIEFLACVASIIVCEGRVLATERGQRAA